MKYSNETSLIGKAANSLDIKGAIRKNFRLYNTVY